MLMIASPKAKTLVACKAFRACWIARSSSMHNSHVLNAFQMVTSTIMLNTHDEAMHMNRRGIPSMISSESPFMAAGGIF